MSRVKTPDRLADSMIAVLGGESRYPAPAMTAQEVIAGLSGHEAYLRRYASNVVAQVAQRTATGQLPTGQQMTALERALQAQETVQKAQK